MTGAGEWSERLASWKRRLRLSRKSPHTIRTYEAGVNGWLAWCAKAGVEPDLCLRQIEEYLDDLSQTRQPGTIAIRQAALRRFGKWLHVEGILPTDPLEHLEPVRLDDVTVPKLSDEDLARLLKTCTGKHFHDRRDEAIIRIAVDTGMRSSELIALSPDDLALDAQTARVRQGKGGKDRVVSYGDAAAVALDRYLVLRRQHPKAAEAPLWLGDRHKRFQYSGLRMTLLRRAERAGVSGFHIHRLRHTWASNWLDRDGTEAGLMAAAGWVGLGMVLRYTKDTAQVRSVDEARRLRGDTPR